jgi:hypothetical protein
MVAMRTMRASPPSVVVLLAVVAACGACGSSGPEPAVEPGVLALGTWGGDSAGLIVSDTASHLHIACTFGDVSGRVPVDASGRFDVAGSYVLRAFPIAVGPSLPARFVGRLAGSVVTVTVTVDDTVQHQRVVRGPVVVRLGDQPKLGPCPICRRPIVTRRR